MEEGEVIISTKPENLWPPSVGANACLFLEEMGGVNRCAVGPGESTRQG